MFEDKLFRRIIWGIIIVFFVICIFPILFTSTSWFGIDFKSTGPIGDTIGGIMGPFIAMVAAVLTFLAFWVQYKANQKQFQQFNKQDIDTKIERFENRFYELLKIHRDNVQEFEIVRFSSSSSNEKVENKLTGRRIFYSMVDELRLSYNIAELANKILIGKKTVAKNYYTKNDLIKVAYLIFFDGISDERLISINAPSNTLRYRVLRQRYDSLVIEFLGLIKEVRADFKRGNDKFFKEYEIDEVVNNHPIRITRSQDTIPYPKLKYIPFSGHNSRLGHYFRHLYQTVKFIVEQDDNIIKDKYAFIKIIRAQLSNYEQALLYYNSISLFGKPWLDEKYLTEWRMIKNIPLYVANFGPLPKEILGETNSKGEKLFEVDEVSIEVAE